MDFGETEGALSFFPDNAVPSRPGNVGRFRTGSCTGGIFPPAKEWHVPVSGYCLSRVPAVCESRLSLR